MAEVKAKAAAVKESVAKEVKEVKKEVKKVAAKAAEKKPAAAKKPAAPKKAPAKKAPAKKAEVKATVNFQFDGKSYTPDDLVKIAKDVWKFDLGNKPADFKNVELYVKPEDGRAYYVVNGEITGSFLI